MHTTLFGRLLGLVLLLASLAQPALADPLPARDAKAVRQVVQAQLTALAADDAVRAFSYAAPAIRSQFGDADTFIGMVRQGYPALIRPRATAFFQPALQDGDVVQVVQLQGSDGSRWLATYQLQRQPGGLWRISGCALAPDDGKQSI